MGTDIHSIAQIKNGNRWQTIAKRVAGDERNYHTFAILANIRNGRGTAGCMTGEGWEPIANPRGFPSDLAVDDEFGVTGAEKGFWFGEHSHSWLTLREIEYRAEKLKNGSYMQSGIVRIDEYQRCIKKNSVPDDWCGGVSGGGVKVVHQLDLKVTPDATHVRMEWTVPITEAAWSLFKIVEHLQKIRDEHGVKSEDVRFVFGFDS